MTTETTLKHTPLYDTHLKYGGKVIDFGGWALPVQYSGIIEEHEAVRNNAGLFDVSHMGEVMVEGKDAESYLNYLVSNDVTKVKINQAQYSVLCYPDGGAVDDLLVYKLAEEKYLVVVNASNTDKDFAWMQEHLKGDVTISNISDEVGQVAIQGPKAEAILQKLTETDLSQIAGFYFAQNVTVDGVTDILVSRTGYTGEDGFELYLAADKVEALWDKLLEAGKEDGLKPCGLGARDTLRFEAKLPLYGQELSKDITGLEAGMGFAIKVAKESDFIGKDALAKLKEEGLKRKIVGLEITGRGIARHDYKVFSTSGEEIGTVTTGTHSPTLKKSLALALVPTEYTQVGTEVKIEIRNKQVDAVVVKSPFYKRG